MKIRVVHENKVTAGPAPACAEPTHASPWAETTPEAAWVESPTMPSRIPALLAPGSDVDPGSNICVRLPPMLRTFP
jgi:hypothetical protein